jgi:hypothetical protein
MCGGRASVTGHSKLLVVNARMTGKGEAKDCSVVNQSWATS